MKNPTKLVGLRAQDTPAELRSGPEHRRQLPPDLLRLAKQPGDRPESAVELDRMLAEIDLQPWSEEAATRWWRTHQPV